MTLPDLGPGMSRFFTMYESPLGPLTLIGGTAGLAALRFSAVGGELVHDEHRPELFDEAVAQLHGYFAGTRRHFDLRLDLGGTPFNEPCGRSWRRSLMGKPGAMAASRHCLAVATALAPSALRSPRPPSRSSFPVTGR